METSLSGQLQQAWLANHMRKQQKQKKCPPHLPSPSPTSRNSSFSCSSSASSPSFHLNDPELEIPHSTDACSAHDESSFCDPVLQYISDILNEEDMEDRKCMMQECISYQATVEEFQNILCGRDDASSFDRLFHPAEHGFLSRDSPDKEGFDDDDGDDDGEKRNCSVDENGKFYIDGNEGFSCCVDERDADLDLSEKKKEDEDWMEDLLKSIGEDVDEDEDEEEYRKMIPLSESSYSTGDFLLPSSQLLSIDARSGMQEAHVNANPDNSNDESGKAQNIQEPRVNRSEDNGKLWNLQETYVKGNQNGNKGNGKLQGAEEEGYVNGNQNGNRGNGKLQGAEEEGYVNGNQNGSKGRCKPLTVELGKQYPCAISDTMTIDISPFGEISPFGFPKLNDRSDSILKPIEEDEIWHSLSKLNGGSDAIEKPFDKISHDGFSKLNNGSGIIENSFGQHVKRHAAEIEVAAEGLKSPLCGGRALPLPTMSYGQVNGKRGSKQDEIVSYVQNENLNAERCGKVLSNGLSFIPYEEILIQRQGGDRGLQNKPKPYESMIDLKSLLMQAAAASNDIGKAHRILQEIRKHSSPYGNGLQRLTHFFAEGLVARLSGTGGRLYTAFTNNAPSAAKMLKAHHLFVEVCPFVKLSHYFANKAILEATKGASKIHIIDYGILYGLQWPCLISALAERKGGPPTLLRITGIDFPQPGVKAAERVEMTGRRLTEYAKTYGVPFEYHAIASKWENIQPSALRIKEGEVLIVNSIYRLRHLLDETVLASNPRKTVLHRIRNLNPKIFVQGVKNGDFNVPFFMSRFKEALRYFECEFNMMDTTIGIENQERMMMEKEVLGRDILNVIACEGPERIERPETYRQWQNRTVRAGFKQVALDRHMLQEAQVIVKRIYDKEFSVANDGDWMLLGWKGQPLYALSVWRPMIPNRH